MSEYGRGRGPELLLDLADKVADQLTRAGLDLDQATRIGSDIASSIAKDWGGQNIYVPLGLSIFLSKRDQEIYEEFNGSNHAVLARKHHVSEQWIYSIVKSAHKAEIARRQGDMFAPKE